MTKRIGLFTPSNRKKKTGQSTTASYVEITAAADLAEKLTALGAKRVALLRRDRTGDTNIEGKMFSVSELEDKHVDWVTAKDVGFETRGIFYDTQ